jgi:putative redox protein
MAIESRLSWKKGFSFDALSRDHHVMLDTNGEETLNAGPTPKEMVVAAMAGCSGIDVVSILKKMRAELRRCDISGHAEKTEGDHPIVFASVRLDFDADNITADKVLRAVELSQTKYCGVTAMIAKTCPVTWTVTWNGKVIGQGKAFS